MSRQCPPKPPGTSNPSPPVPTSNGSTQELSDKAKLAMSDVLALLQDTSWPTESKDAAQKLVQTINHVPDLPRDVNPFKDSVEELIHVLEAARASLKKASDKYATKQRGFWDGIKHAFYSMSRGKCTDILQTCRADIETVSTTLRLSRLESSGPIVDWRPHPVPTITEIGRIPEEKPEPLSEKHGRQGTTKPPSSRNEQNNSKEAEVGVGHPHEGLDAETEQNAVVIDYDTNQEMEKVIAQTASMLNLQKPLNATFAFQKVFADGDFVAAGVLEIPVGGNKPTKSARDNTYLFYCIEGAVRVMVHRTTFVIARNGMFMVPRGNQYSLENISDRDCKLFFAQARKVTENMIPSPTTGASIGPAGLDASAR